MNTTEWHAGDRFMLRVAGLPLSTVEGLRAAGTRGWAEDVLAAEAGLREGAERLGDVLHEAVGATDPAPDGTGAAQRRALLRLRRQIHNDRLPARPDASTETAVEAVAAVDECAAEQLAGWLHRRRLLDKLLAEGPPLLIADLDRNRAALRELVADDRLRLGLLLASPALEGQLDGYARRGPAERAGPQGRTVRPVVRLPHRLQDQPLQHLHRRGDRTLHGRARTDRSGCTG